MVANLGTRPGPARPPVPANEPAALAPAGRRRGGIRKPSRTDNGIPPSGRHRLPEDDVNTETAPA